MTDAELVQQALAGRADAYGELVRRWAPRIVALCHGKTGRRGAAEDLAQETLLRGYRALSTLHEPDKFGSWLYGIALRSCRDWLKAKERSQISFSDLGAERQRDDFPAGERSGEGQGTDRQEEGERLLRGVESLPEEYRAVVMLFYYQELKYRDIADLLGISPATVNARLTKARNMLRMRLADALRE